MSRLAWLLLPIAWLFAWPAAAQPTNFEHVVVIVQENRTPDNLFYALCSAHPCSTHPDKTTYDIQTANWLDKDAQGGTIQPTAAPLATAYGPAHSHRSFLTMCDFDAKTGGCRMDGAGKIFCKNCPPNAQFTYVDNSHHAIDPYLFLASQYGWANYMFQTNQGPSFPAHQFLFGGTSAPNKTADHKGTFAAENLKNPGIIQGTNTANGCLAPPPLKVQLINSKGEENLNNQIYPCFDHQTLGDLLVKRAIKWRYYTPGAGSLWSAPDAIKHICQPKQHQCTGPLWQKDVALNPLDVLQDVSKCQLRNVSWVIPSGQFSDHAGMNTGIGPAWVASVVNAIGNSSCRNGDGSTYWNSTAFVITWDDWGGFYDHEPPTFLPYPEGGYQYGFRVPMIFVSAYTPKGYINNKQLDFGSIVRFIEFNFGIPMGELTFADARTTRNLARFYDLTQTPRAFGPVPAPPFTFAQGGNAAKPKLEPPDDD